MRLAFAGALARIEPIVFVFTSDDVFDKTLYPQYTNYDVIAIAGGGGRGGGCSGIDTNDSDITLRSYGGAGGGGGFHRVQGLLDVIDDSIDVVVGTAGTDGVDEVSDPLDATDGGDGNPSAFGDFCLAGGGKGGKKVVSCSITEDLEADGGESGMGGQTTAGYGSLGGVCGSVVDDIAGIDGLNGILWPGPLEYTPGFFTALGLVGSGGGGGAGGIAKVISPSTEWSGSFPFATRGGKGAYDYDELVFDPGSKPFLDPVHYMRIGPGRGGGARITPLNKSMHLYGGSSQPGIVAIKLTKE